MENNIEIHIDNESQYNTENSVENFSENTVELNNETTDKKSLIEDFIKLITQKLQPNKINTQLEQSKEEVNEGKNEQQLENNIQSNNLEKQKEEILVIDRFEDGFAVCENRSTLEMKNIKISEIPNTAKEGDVIKFINNKYELDEQTKIEIEERINNKIQNLFDS